MKNLIIIIKLFFIISVLFFLLAIFIENSWVPELLASLSVSHALSTVAFIIIFVLVKYKRWVFYGVSLLMLQSTFLISIYFYSAPLMKSNNEEIFTIVQYNVHYLNPSVKDIVDWLESQQNQHDIVFLQEVNMNMKKELKRLEEYYPYQVIERKNRFFGRAFLSKLPITSFNIKYYEESQRHYFVINMKTLKGKDVKFFGLHTLAPFSSKYLEIRNLELEEVSKIISKTPSQYVILSGDLNTTPYSTTFRKILKATGLKRPRCITASWPADLPIPSALCIQLDHLLVSSKIDFLSQKTGKNIGSDHLPVITKIVLRGSCHAPIQGDELAPL